MPLCCFVGFLSTSVLTWISSQIKLAWFSLESSYFASISICSSKDSHRPNKVFIQKSGVLVILGHGKLTDSLKIKHTIIILFYFRVPSKGSHFTAVANFIGFGPRVPNLTRFIRHNIYSDTFCHCVTFRYNNKLLIPCHAKTECQAPSLRTLRREPTGGSLFAVKGPLFTATVKSSHKGKFYICNHSSILY